MILHATCILAWKCPCLWVSVSLQWAMSLSNIYVAFRPRHRCVHPPLSLLCTCLHVLVLSSSLRMLVPVSFPVVNPWRSQERGLQPLLSFPGSPASMTHGPSEASRRRRLSNKMKRGSHIPIAGGCWPSESHKGRSALCVSPRMMHTL